MKGRWMQKPDNLLSELLDLIGTEGVPQMTPEDVNDFLQKGVPLALREQLNLITGASQEKIKAWMIKEWLDRSGYTPVTKIAVQKKISLDEKTLKVLAKISEEDGDVIDAVEVLEIQESREGQRAEQETTAAASRDEQTILPEEQGEAPDPTEAV
jgi:hypothetical protein